MQLPEARKYTDRYFLMTESYVKSCWMLMVLPRQAEKVNYQQSSPSVSTPSRTETNYDPPQYNEPRSFNTNYKGISVY